jgi:hypothetical protein
MSKVFFSSNFFVSGKRNLDSNHVRGIFSVFIDAIHSMCVLVL